MSRICAQGQARVSDRSESSENHIPLKPQDQAEPVMPPLMPAFYNNTLQIVQTRESVVLLSEQIHDARVIALTRQTHLPASVQRWAGDSIGHWEGDTLVVDTTNFSPRTTLRGSGTGLHLVERFSREDDQTLRYEFTLDNPEIWTKPFTVSMPMARSDEMVFEYACHEANYAMGNILRGAHQREADAKKGSSR